MELADQEIKSQNEQLILGRYDIDVSDVKLTAEEEQDAISQALEKKRTKIRSERYWKLVNAPKPIPVFTAEKYLQLCLDRFKRTRGFDFEIDKWNKSIVDKLSWYFTSDQRAIDSGISLNKGIMLQGNVGCGKTLIMQLFNINPLCSYRFITCNQVADEFNQFGIDVLKEYYGLCEAAGQNPFQQKSFGFCFDDMGTEGDKNHFGNKLSPMSQVIQNRYANLEPLKLQSKTHVTTNLSIPKIAEYYDMRIASRFKELFNQIAFNAEAPDRRK